MTFIVHDAKNRIESIWRRKIGKGVFKVGEWGGRSLRQ